MNSTQSIPTGLPLAPARGRAWELSLPMMLGVFTYLASMYQALFRNLQLRDGDTTWHIATGRWVLQHMAVPEVDPFSHSRAGAVWTAHEWLSDVLLAIAHDYAGFTGVVALTSLAFALAIALLARALLPYFSPTRCILLAVVAMLMTAAHLLARPHIIAMPLLVLWVSTLVRAVDTGRTPPWWLLPVMVAWANLHGSFTLGMLLAFALGAEAGWLAWQRGAGRDGQHGALRVWLRGWGLFLALALVAAVITPHGTQGILYTWQVMVEDSYALSRVGEWASPNFHEFQPMMLWLLGGLALVLTQGLRLPPMRLLLVLGLLYLSLKHVRNVELLGLLVPLFVAAPFSAQWAQMAQAPGRTPEQPDRLQRWLARRPLQSGAAISTLCVAAALAIAPVAERARPLMPPELVAPAHALQAARAAGVRGHVLNGYGFGGYLIFEGIPVHIDGRSDMYREAHMREFVDALEMREAGGFEALLNKYQIGWTMLPPELPVITLLDRSPDWKRVYKDDIAAVHMRVKP